MGCEMCGRAALSTGTRGDCREREIYGVARVSTVRQSEDSCGVGTYYGAGEEQGSC